MKKTFPKDTYFVAVKVFLENEDGAFLITKDVFGDWDIPGGRLRTNDFKVSLVSVVKRKLREELGSAFRVRISKEPVVFMRHERNEIVAPGKREKKRIFALGFQATFLGGRLTLGKNHERFLWLNPATDKPQKYLTGGWLQGAKDYIAIKKKQ